MILKYSLKRDGNKYITSHFKVKEFACKDGSDTIYVDYNLVLKLEQVRVKTKTPIVFNSAYRTVRWNKRIGGETYSYHTYGKAVDVPNMKLASAFRKAGLFVLPEKSWLHIDTRDVAPSGRYPTLRYGSKGEWVVYLQEKLSDKGFKTLRNARFDRPTKINVMSFQKRHGLKPDGIVGKITWGKLIK